MPNEPVGVPRLHLEDDPLEEEAWLEEDNAALWVLLFGVSLGCLMGAILVGLIWWLL